MTLSGIEERFSLVTIDKEIFINNFSEAVKTGLTSESKYLSFVYFYDHIGSQLFEQICELPEYYLTRTEADILETNFLTEGSWLQFLSAFTVSTTLNVFFAPVFMTVHKITDTHILMNKGKLLMCFRPIQIRKIITEMNWSVQWNFVFKKTIPLFWIPAQTVNFLLPGEYRVLVAAIYSIILGIILAIAAQMGRVRPT